jgi:hypothetical protein
MPVRAPVRQASSVRLALLLGAAALLSGCQSLAGNSAQLRILDASPDAGLIDAYQNNTGLAYNLQFGTVTTYAAMQPGAYTLSAAKSGTRQTLVSGSASLASGRQYTEIVGNVAGDLQQFVLEDQNQPAPAGQIAVRLLNESPRCGHVDVYLVPRGGRLASTPPLAVNLAFSGLTGYIDVPAGAYAIDVVPTGTVLVSYSTTLMSGAQVAYDSGSVRTVVILDQETLGAQHSPLTPGVQAIIATDFDPMNE